jgi:hypothetical protein
MKDIEETVKEVLELSDMYRRHTRPAAFKGGLTSEEFSRQYVPDIWKIIDRRRVEEAIIKADAGYLDPYMQATGEYLEYICGRPLNNPVTGDTV